MENVDLNDIRLFVSVVQAGNLSKAADLTGIPKSRLSRRLSRLEGHLGTCLMDRSKRGVALNDVGERFYQHAQVMLSAAQQAVEDIAGNLHTPSGVLKIVVSTELGRGFLMGYLGDYLHSYPEVSLDVQIDNRKINLIQDGTDIALCFGLPENDNVVARKLTEIELGLFASPDYLAYKGQPKSPHELYGHMLLRRTHLSWQFVYKNHHVSVEGAQRLLSNDFNLIGQMVSDGVGIALLPCFPNMVRPEWIRLLPEWEVEKLPVYLVYYRNRGNVAAVRSLVDFLFGKIKSHNIQ